MSSPPIDSNIELSSLPPPVFNKDGTISFNNKTYLVTKLIIGGEEANTSTLTPDQQKLILKQLESIQNNPESPSIENAAKISIKTDSSGKLDVIYKTANDIISHTFSISSDGKLNLGSSSQSKSSKKEEDKDLDSAVRDSKKLEAKHAEMIERNRVANQYFTNSLSKFYHKVDCPGNGDCFFVGIAKQIRKEEFPDDCVNDDQKALFVRKQIADYMQAHADEYKGRVDGDVKTHITNLRQSSKGKAEQVGWGEFIHAQVASKCFGRPVYIFDPNDDKQLGTKKDNQDNPLPSNQFSFAGKGEPINLFYNGINHYDVLIPKVAEADNVD